MPRKKKAVATLFNHHGGFVRNAESVEEAQRLIIETFLEERDYRVMDMSADELDKLFPVGHARHVYARQVPVGPNDEWAKDEGYTWIFRTGYLPGKPGVMDAWVWDEDF